MTKHALAILLLCACAPDAIEALSTVDGGAAADAACTHYASPSGGGNGLGPTSPFQISDFWSLAAPGHTLCLLDGVYATSIDPPDNLNGTAMAPITVRALHDGAVRIDGQNVRIPVLLQNNAYFVIEGIDAHNSAGGVFRVAPGADHVVFRRVVGWDARDANHDILSTSGSDTLFEDAAGFGVARKIVSCSQGGDRCICRRCWLRWEGSTNVGPKMGITLWYNNVGQIVENTLVTWDNGSMPATYTLQNNGALWTGNGAGTYTAGRVDQPYGLFSRDNISTTTVARARIVGSIGYVRGAHRYDADSLYFLNNKDDVQVVNSVAYAEPGNYDTKVPFWLYGTNANLVATDLASVGASADSIASAWHPTDVQHASSTAGLADSIFSGTGARICLRYQDGVETSSGLWPWPMNARILAATTFAARSDHRHFIYQGNPPALTSVNDPHAVEDVTATIEALFGAIPDACKACGEM